MMDCHSLHGEFECCKRQAVNSAVDSMGFKDKRSQQILLLALVLCPENYGLDL